MPFPFKHCLFFLIFWAIALGELTFISSTVAQIKTSAKHKFDKPIQSRKSSTRSHFRQLKAIIRLVHTKLPFPKTTGEGRLKLERLKDGIAWTMNVTISDRIEKVLLDTGASISMVSPALTKGLELIGQELTPEETRYAVAGNDCQEMKAAIYQLPIIALGTAKVEGLHTLQLSQAIIPEKLAGILGMDVLSHFNFQIDPARQELQLFPPSSVPISDRAQAIPLVMRDGVALVPVNINNSLTFLFLIDTGAESTFISPQVAAKLKLSPELMKPIQVQGFCGLEAAHYTTLKEVKIGDRALNNIESVVLQNTGVLNSLKVDGILGQNFLNGFRQYWYFDHSSFPTTGYLKLIPLH